MTRNLIAAFCTFAGGAVLAGLVLAQTSGASFGSKQLSVTNIDPKHFNAHLVEGTFSFRGLPILHAALPEKHVTLDAARIDGTIDTATKLLKTAKLTGGVKGTMESTSADGLNHTNFSGATVNYTNMGNASDQSADIEVFGGAEFGSTNETVARKLSLKGTHGIFKMRPIIGSLDAQGNVLVGLANADLDGPVTIDFSGVMVAKDNSKKPPVTKKTPVSGTATGGHLTVSRPESGTDYIIRMSGGVHLLETRGPNAGAQITTTVVNLEFDAMGVLIKFWGEDEATTTVPIAQPAP